VGGGRDVALAVMAAVGIKIAAWLKAACPSMQSHASSHLWPILHQEEGNWYRGITENNSLGFVKVSGSALASSTPAPQFL